MAGTPILQNDIWIAALARQTGLPVATTDDHFDRVANLAVLKWSPDEYGRSRHQPEVC